MQSLWSAEHGRPIFNATMGYQRFRTLIRFLRFDNKGTRNQRYRNDKFAPIREIFLIFQEQIALLYWPNDSITVDEQLFPSRNRCPFLQYMPNKPAKFGIKFWMAADSTSRYVLSVNPYLGRDEDDGISGTLGEKVVLRQTQQYYHKWVSSSNR